MARPPMAKSSLSPKKAQAAGTIKKHKRQKKDPNAPKRAKSAYMFWLAENRARLSKPGLSVVDVTRAAGAEWGTVKDKSKWEKMAAEDKKRYEKESAKYKSGGAGSSKSKGTTDEMVTPKKEKAKAGDKKTTPKKGSKKATPKKGKAKK
uniref:HMG box domain-containing protein n=1 Tax=Parascaris univalens TaxID=6257 RepID=A0A915AIB8_PARUN